MKRILITGGAGYIGGFMAEQLLNDGHDVVIVDSLERGHKELIDSRATFIQEDLSNASFLKSLFSDYSFEAVIHFAAYISMAESMKDPAKYFWNNTMTTLGILEQMKE